MSLDFGHTLIKIKSEMKDDFCRFFGSILVNCKMLNEIYILICLKRTVKAIRIWACENCSEEFFDDSSVRRLYANVRSVKRAKSMAS